MNFENYTIGIIGLDYLGRSLALNICRVHPKSRIYGCEANPEIRNYVQEDGTLAELMETPDERLAACDILFLCGSMQENMELLKALQSYPSVQGLITDVGSVKSPMQEAIKEMELGGHFIGGHPMIGTENKTYLDADSHLLENAYYFLTPSSETMFQFSAMFSSFIQSLGALPVTLKPEEHDYVIAFISHMPHIAAAEMVHMVKKADKSNGMFRQLAAGGFKDITRSAASSPEMWEQICLDNAEYLKDMLLGMSDDLRNLAEHLAQKDGESIRKYFDEAREYRDSIPDQGIRLFEKEHRLYVSIPDEPGTLAGVVSQIGYNQINIKNVSIVYNREHEEAAMSVDFYDEEACQRAFKVLTDRNFKVNMR